MIRVNCETLKRNLSLSEDYHKFIEIKFVVRIRKDFNPYFAILVLTLVTNFTCHIHENFETIGFKIV